MKSIKPIALKEAKILSNEEMKLFLEVVVVTAAWQAVQQIVVLNRLYPWLIAYYVPENVIVDSTYGIF